MLSAMTPRRLRAKTGRTAAGPAVERYPGAKIRAWGLRRSAREVGVPSMRAQLTQEEKRSRMKPHCRCLDDRVVPAPRKFFVGRPFVSTLAAGLLSAALICSSAPTVAQKGMDLSSEEVLALMNWVAEIDRLKSNVLPGEIDWEGTMALGRALNPSDEKVKALVEQKGTDEILALGEQLKKEMYASSKYEKKYNECVLNKISEIKTQRAVGLLRQVCRSEAKLYYVEQVYR